MNQESRLNSIQVKKPRCPFCHDDIRAEDQKAGCNQCMAWFHEECWLEHGGCTSCASPAEESSRPRVPRGQLRSRETPSIHNRLGYALITEGHKKEAINLAHSETMAATLRAFLFSLFFVLFSFLVTSTDFAMFVLFVLWPTFLMVYYPTVFGIKKQAKLKQVLKRILEERNQPSARPTNSNAAAMNDMKS